MEFVKTEILDINNTAFVYKSGEKPHLINADAVQTYIENGWTETPVTETVTGTITEDEKKSSKPKTKEKL